MKEEEKKNLPKIFASHGEGKNFFFLLKIVSISLDFVVE